MRIDAHHHFWHYTPTDYGWISDDMARIRRDFLPTDLKPEIRAAGIDGVISVQARQSIEETDWLLQLATENSFILGVTGWLPLASPEIDQLLEKFSGNLHLKALRHVVQDEPDDNFILRADFNRGISRLAEYGLVYEILIFEKHLPQTIEFVDRHPEQSFVLDHIAKPRIRENLLTPWRENIRELARRGNVSCKISGMVTEADPRNWTPQQLQPYFETVLEAFGPQRLMFGSDWPVCLTAAEYPQWVQTAENFIADLSPDEQNLIMGANAQRIYNL